MRAELQAILAHEFGHFSQRSMKVGSYVYTVNQIIFNMLFDNEGYGKVIQKFAGVSSYIAIFVAFGIKIIEGIQSLLRKLYNLVNLQHLELSREMEFHADAIAVYTIGTKPFISSMMRLNLANYSFDRTVEYYEQKIASNIKPQNIYPQHRFVMNTLAEDAGITFINGWPNVTKESLNRYHKSKLVINNQWASHPSTEDRIAAISNGDFQMGVDNGEPATVLFVDIDALQSSVTTVLFANVNYNGEVIFDEIHDFEADYLKKMSAKRFPELFNGYYDNYNPKPLNLQQYTAEEVSNFDQLYEKDKVDMIYDSFSLETDINTLKQIQTEETDVKSFEYDGIKYQKLDLYELLPKLEMELNELKTSISMNDEMIDKYFKKSASNNNRLDSYLEKYTALVSFDKIYDDAMEVYSQVLNQTQFIQYTTPFEEIEANFIRFETTEMQWKEQINKLLALPISANVSFELKDKLDEYLSIEKLCYFEGSSYHNDQLDLLFYAINAFRDMLYKFYFETKRDLLEEMASIQLNNRVMLA